MTLKVIQGHHKCIRSDWYWWHLISWQPSTANHVFTVVYLVPFQTYYHWGQETNNKNKNTPHLKIMYIYHHNQSASQSRSVQFHLFVDMIGGPKISKRPLDLDYAQLGGGLLVCLSPLGWYCIWPVYNIRDSSFNRSWDMKVRCKV